MLLLQKTSLNYWIKIVASSSSTTLKQNQNNQNSNSKTYNVQIMPIYFLLFFKQKQVQMISKIIIQYLSLTLLLMRAIYYFRHTVVKYMLLKRQLSALSSL